MYTPKYVTKLLAEYARGEMSVLPMTGAEAALVITDLHELARREGQERNRHAGCVDSEAWLAERAASALVPRWAMTAGGEWVRQDGTYVSTMTTGYTAYGREAKHCRAYLPGKALAVLREDVSLDYRYRHRELPFRAAGFRSQELAKEWLDKYHPVRS